MNETVLLQVPRVSCERVECRAWLCLVMLGYAWLFHATRAMCVVALERLHIANVHGKDRKFVWIQKCCFFAQVFGNADFIAYYCECGV
jgi:hypothetical protein